VIFLINNRGYTIERCWLGKTARYNDVANWAYADLPKVFRPDTTARSRPAAPRQHADPPGHLMW
jgi:indolepyruvate decarboxylase